MKRSLTAALLLVAGLSIGATFARATGASPSLDITARAQAGPEPWHVGRCYRVFPQNRDQFYLFRVVEAPRGPHVRVAAEPPPRLAPGASPPPPLWLIVGSQFAVQEWSCAS